MLLFQKLIFCAGKLQNVGQFGHVEIKIITEKRHGKHFCKSIGNKTVVEGVFNHYKITKPYSCNYASSDSNAKGLRFNDCQVIFYSASQMEGCDCVLEILISQRNYVQDVFLFTNLEHLTFDRCRFIEERLKN